MQDRTKIFLSRLIYCLFAIALIACGGGGGGGGNGGNANQNNNVSPELVWDQGNWNDKQWQ